MPRQETFAKLAEQLALGRALVSSPLASDPVGIQVPETLARLRTANCVAPMERRGTPIGRGSAVGPMGPARTASTGHLSHLPAERERLIPPRSLSLWPMAPYYECPKCGGGYVIDAPPSSRPICDRDGARLKRASDASYERSARED